MTAIMLTRTDSRRDRARFYKLDVQPTLFGECSLVRERGRIGRAGTVRIETYRSRGVADIAMAENWVRKLKRGYR
ncbi:putative DNA-binding WGR domain protein [Bradyrhizobium stylosanthis]|uniref:Putative DNA-binding WGR domain protein n=2 Tax=Bradyrhizobium stylosanthis TaxID=1803665 RepID=A0A560CX08_9BRAD|nr:putative DNA-binding WGR domain protein [Bradyrhizobium stylosanthis]